MHLNKLNAMRHRPCHTADEWKAYISGVTRMFEWGRSPNECAYISGIWCPETESNRRHEDFQSSALPTELSGLYWVLSSVLIALLSDQEEGSIKPVLNFPVNNKLMKSGYFLYCRGFLLGRRGHVTVCLVVILSRDKFIQFALQVWACLLYTSDAADE